MRKAYFVWAPVAIGVFVLGIIFAGGKTAQFVSFASFIVVIVPPFAVSLGSYSFREIGRCFSVGFSTETPNAAELRKGIVFFRSLARIILVTGFVGFLLGAIVILLNLSDAAQVGWGFSLAILTVLYALVFIVVVAGPFRAGLEKRLAEIGGPTAQ